MLSEARSPESHIRPPRKKQIDGYFNGMNNQKMVISGTTATMVAIVSNKSNHYPLINPASHYEEGIPGIRNGTEEWHSAQIN